MSTVIVAQLRCAVQAPGQTCHDVETMWSPVDLLPVGIAAVVLVTVAAIVVALLVRMARWRSRRASKSGSA